MAISKELLIDFYSKYAPEKVDGLTDEKLQQIDSVYGGDYKTMITDLYAKYAPDQAIDDAKINKISEVYGLKKKESTTPTGGKASTPGSLPPGIAAPTTSKKEETSFYGLPGAKEATDYNIPNVSPITPKEKELDLHDLMREKLDQANAVQDVLPEEDKGAEFEERQRVLKERNKKVDQAKIYLRNQGELIHNSETAKEGFKNTLDALGLNEKEINNVIDSAEKQGEEKAVNAWVQKKLENTLPVGFGPQTKDALANRMMANRLMKEQDLVAGLEILSADQRRLYDINNELEELNKKQNKTAADLSKIAELRKSRYEIDSSFKPLYDGTTGKALESAGINPEDYATQTEAKANQYKETYKDKLASAYTDAAHKYQYYREKFTPELAALASRTAEYTTSDIEDIKAGIAKPRGADFEKRRKEAIALRDKYLNAKQEFDAMAQAYLVNTDPSGEIKGTASHFFKTGGKALLDAIVPEDIFPYGEPAAMNDPDGRKFAQAFNAVLQNKNIPLTEAQKEQAQISFGESVAEGLGGLVGILPKLAIAKNVFGVASDFAGLATVVQRLEQGTKLEQIGAKLINAGIEETSMQAAGLAPGAGAGFALSHNLLGNVGLKLKGPVGAIVQPFVNKVVGGAIGGTAGMETASALEGTIEGLKHNKTISEELNKRFPNLSEVGKRLASEFIVNGVFGMGQAALSKADMTFNVDKLNTLADELYKAGNKVEAEQVRKKANQIAGVNEASAKLAKAEIQGKGTEQFVAPKNVTQAEIETIAQKVKDNKEFSDREEQIVEALPQQVDNALKRIGEEPLPKTEEAKPAITPEEEAALQITTPLEENVGKMVNYEGVEGVLQKDKEGNLFVHADDGTEVLVEGGLSGKPAAELGVRFAAPKPEVEVKEQHTEPIPDNQITFDYDNNIVNIYGKDYTYEGVETDAKGNTTALRVRDSKGKVKFIRNEDAILEFEIQKELAENRQLDNTTAEEITKTAEENEITPETKPVEPSEKAAEQVQQERPTEAAPPFEEPKIEIKAEEPKPKKATMLDELHEAMGTKPEAKPEEAKPEGEKPKKATMLDELHEAMGTKPEAKTEPAKPEAGKPEAAAKPARPKKRAAEIVTEQTVDKLDETKRGEVQNKVIKSAKKVVKAMAKVAKVVSKREAEDGDVVYVDSKIAGREPNKMVFDKGEWKSDVNGDLFPTTEENQKAAAGKWSEGKELTLHIHDDVDSYTEAVEAAGGTAQQAAGSKGFWMSPDGEIHLNMAKVTAETMMHEGFHPVLDYIAENRPEMLDKLYDQLGKVKGGQKVIDQAKKAYKGDPETTIKKEAITDYIAKVASGDIKIDRTNFEKVRDFIVKTLNQLGFNVGLDIKTVEDLQDLARNISIKFKTGKEIKVSEGIIGSEVATEPKFSKEERVSEMLKDDVESKVVAGKTVSTRLPNTGTEHSVNEYKVSLEEQRKSPANYLKNAIVIADYDLVGADSKTKSLLKKGLKETRKGGDQKVLEKAMLKADEVYNSFIRKAADNLLSLHDSFDQPIRKVSKRWYDGANVIAQEFAKKYNSTLEQAAAVIAVLSPKKDWYTNVDNAKRILNIYKNHMDFVITKDMMDKYIQLSGVVVKKASDTASQAKKREAQAKEKQEAAKKTAETLIGKKIKDTAEFLPEMVRVYDETYNDPSFDILSPNGKSVGKSRNKPTKAELKKDSNAQGPETKTSWAGYTALRKALSILQDGSQENISKQLGEAHKVRSFNNNIVDPNSPDGHITADTHAAAAALWKPLAANDTEVANHMFGGSSDVKTGLIGTYPAMAEAYRLAAKERGILPREMQSITWEAVRGLFTDSFKSGVTKDAEFLKKVGFADNVVKKATEEIEGVKPKGITNKAVINKIWENERNGKITIDEARKQITEFAQGVDDPSWTRSSSESSLFEEAAPDAGELPMASILGAKPGAEPGGVTGGETKMVQPTSKIKGKESKPLFSMTPESRKAIEDNTSEEVTRIKGLDKKAEDGSTMNLDGTKYEGGGLVVPVESINTTQGKLTPKMIADFVEANESKIPEGSTFKVGLYKFPDKNQVSIDLNIVVDPAHKDTALKFGKLAGQESLFNLDDFKNLKTGASGANPRKFSDEQYREISSALAEGRKPNISGDEDLVKGTYVEPELTQSEDGENYVFYHVSGADPKSIAKGIDSTKKYSTATSKAEKGSQYGVASFYTKPTDSERMIGGAKYTVSVPKEKVYPMNEDPNNYHAEAEKLYPQGTPDRQNKIRKAIAESAKNDGYEMAVGEWGYKRTGEAPVGPAMRADALVPLKPTEVKQKGYEGPAIPHPEKDMLLAQEEVKKFAQKVYDMKNEAGKFDDLYHAAVIAKEDGIKTIADFNALTKDLKGDLAKEAEALKSTAEAAVTKPAPRPKKNIEFSMAEPDAKKDVYYHVTAPANRESILNKGLIPQIGDYSLGINETNKVSVSKADRREKLFEGAYDDDVYEVTYPSDKLKKDERLFEVGNHYYTTEPIDKANIKLVRKGTGKLIDEMTDEEYEARNKSLDEIFSKSKVEPALVKKPVGKVKGKDIYFSKEGMSPEQEAKLKAFVEKKMKAGESIEDIKDVLTDYGVAKDKIAELVGEPKVEAPKEITAQKETIDKFSELTTFDEKLKEASGSKRRKIEAQREQWLNENPSMKAIYNNAKEIIKQLEDKEIITEKKGPCFS